MIGERLRVARARARMTMADVAQHCGCTAQAVKKWEHDQSMPNSQRLILLCDLYNISAEWLIDPAPLDFHSTGRAPQGRHAKYWVREALAEMMQEGLVVRRERAGTSQ